MQNIDFFHNKKEKKNRAKKREKTINYLHLLKRSTHFFLKCIMNEKLGQSKEEEKKSSFVLF